MTENRHSSRTGLDLHWPKPHGHEYHLDMEHTHAEIDDAVDQAHDRVHAIGSEEDHRGLYTPETDHIVGVNSGGMLGINSRLLIRDGESIYVSHTTNSFIAYLGGRFCLYSNGELQISW